MASAGVFTVAPLAARVARPGSLPSALPGRYDLRTERSEARLCQASRGLPLVVLGAALLVRRAPRRADSSASDRLLYDSLRREVGRMKSRRRKKDEVSQVRWIRPALQGGPRRRSLASFSGAPVAARFLGAVCFLGPLVLAIPYGAQFFASSSTLRELVLKPLLPLVLAYHSSRFANLLCIAALYGLIARNKSLHPLTCSLGRQASTLMMMQFPANFLLQFLGATPGPLANLTRAIIFLYFVYSVSLGVLGSLRGRAFELPFVGTGAGAFSLRSPRPSSFRSS